MKLLQVYSYLLVLLILSSNVIDVHSKIVFNRLHKKRLMNKKNTATTKASRFEMIGAVTMFFLQIIAKLSIPKFSEIAQKTVKFKQFSESCYRGITDLMGFKYPPSESDSDFQIDTSEIQKLIDETKVELQKEAKYYLGPSISENILNDSQKLCDSLVTKLKSTPFDAKDDSSAFKTVFAEFTSSFTAANTSPCLFLIANGKRDHFYRKIAEYFSPSCLLTPFRVGYLTPVPYTYYGMPMNYDKIQKIYDQRVEAIKKGFSDEALMLKIFQDSIADEKDRRAKIMQCSENLKEVKFDNDASLKFLSVLNKIVGAIRKANDFYQGCLKPAYDYVKTKVEQAEAKKRKEAEEKALEDIRTKIQAATSLEQIAYLVPNMTPEQTQALKSEFERVAQYQADIKRLTEEVKAWDTLKEDMRKYVEEEDRKQKETIAQAAKEREIKEAEMDSILYFSEDGYTPSQLEKENIKLFNSDPTIKKEIYNSIKEAGKEEIVNFVNGELEELKKNPIEYSLKIAKERGVFLACPECYIAKAGGEFVVSVGFNLLGKAKDEYVKNNEFLQKHTLIAKGVDEVYNHLTGKAKGKLSEFIGVVTSKRPGLHHNRFTKASRNGKTSVKVAQMREIVKEHLKISNLERNYALAAEKVKKERIQKRNNILLEIAENIKAIFAPMITKYICGAVEKALINLLGGFGTVWMLITKGKAIYDILKKVTAGINESNIIEKWSDYGEAVGLGMLLITGSDSGFCSRRRRFARRAQRMCRVEEREKRR